MPPSNQHTTTSGHADLLLNLDDPSPFRPVDQEPATLDRTILGIPNENDEYTRGLTFLFDLSTGQPSVHSTSEESEDPIETSRYEPSISSNNTGSRIVYTPQSGSDLPADLHSQVVSPRSVGSSDGGSCHGKADRPPPSPISACATFGTSTASASAPSTMEGESLPAAESFTSTDLSPVANSNINLDQDDINFLTGIMPKTKQEEGSQRTGTRTTRTSKLPGPRHDPIGPRVSPKTGMDRAQMIEKAKMMRRIGVCLPCLVNHEPVSRGQNQPDSFSKDMLTLKVCPRTSLP